jgi:hypothetical protein
LRQKEEIDLACGQSGVLKMAGRTGIAGLQGIFGVEKIDKEREKQE